MPLNVETRYIEIRESNLYTLFLQKIALPIVREYLQERTNLSPYNFIIRRS